MKKLFLIPARGGSKGLPNKNVLLLDGHPMIKYSIDAALGVIEDEDELCVTTDSEEIIKVVRDFGINVPFKRPESLASDKATTEDVIKHAINWYKDRNIFFDILVLLQPTSPLRNSKHIKEALNLWKDDVDLVVSVKETDSNPYYVLFEEDANGWLSKSKEGKFNRRQDCPDVYELNGAIYIFKTNEFDKKGFINLKKRRKYLMTREASIDIDIDLDFLLAELILKKNKKK